jgi:hypothetical protein
LHIYGWDWANHYILSHGAVSRYTPICVQLQDLNLKLHVDRGTFTISANKLLNKLITFEILTSALGFLILKILAGNDYRK